MKNFKKLIKEAYLGNPLNEDIQPLAVEKLTDKALLDMLNNIDDMSRDKKGGTYDMSGRKMTSAQYDLAKSVEAEVRRREKERGLKIHYVDNERYEFMESINEVESGDIVSYEGEDHTVMRIADDDLGIRIYIRPNEEAVFGGKKDTFWVKPEDLEMTPEEEHEHVKNLLKRNFMDEAEARVDEIDMNDPALIAARAAKMADEKEKAKQADLKQKEDFKKTYLNKKYGSSFMDKLDAEIGLKGELEDLKQEREMIMIDMEQEAEPEGGEIADRYGSRLNKIDARMELIQKDIDDLRMYESVNEEKTYRIYMNSDAGEPNEINYEEFFGDGTKVAMIKQAMGLAKDKTNQYGDPIKLVVTAEDDIEDVVWTNKPVNEDLNENRFRKNQDSYIRITEPRFSKDKNSPNFLFGRINYDTGPGVGTALGKETMAGQIRRLSSMEAMRRMKAIAVQLEDAFDLEDIDVYDKENGVVELFAVSDDFIDMDPRSELSMAMLEENEEETDYMRRRRGDYSDDMEDGMTDFERRRKEMSDYMNEELLKEITLDGGNYQDSYGNNPADDQLSTPEDYEIFMEMFPRGEASRILMDPKRKELYDKHLEWTKEYDGNFTFEHMQYHLINHDGEEYKVHQSQYYNGNYNDFRNPRFTELTISKDGKRMGTYLVDTKEYVKDLEDLEIKNKVMEGTCGYGKNGKIGDKPSGPVDEETDTDVGGGADQDKEYNFNISNANDIADEQEANSGVVGETKGFNFKQMVKEALTPNNLK